jgi:hypothetical protein
MKSKVKIDSPDPDIRGSWPALKRAAKKARALSIATGTPFYVMQNGRIVDLNQRRSSRPAKNRRSTRQRS